MKTRLLLLLLITTFSFINAQGIKKRLAVNNNSFEIGLEFSSVKYLDKTEGTFTVRDYFLNTDESRPGQFKLPQKNIIVAIPPNSKPILKIKEKKIKQNKGLIPQLNPGVKLANDSSTAYWKQEVYNNIRNENSELIKIERYFWYREFYCAEIKIQTHYFDKSSNTINELTDLSFELVFDGNINIKNDSPIQTKSSFDNELIKLFANNQIAEQFRAKSIFAENKYDDWINYDAAYLKIKISEDGVYRITKTQFEELGINLTGVNPRTFNLFESGKEIPIFVSGENNSSFDENDFIEFIGSKNYSKVSPRIINEDSEPYNEYLNRYTDTTIYFLTWGNSNGKRAPVQNIYNSALVDTLDYYHELVHLEEHPIDALFYTFHESIVESQLPFWDTGKAWYWRFLAGFSKNLNFNINLSDIKPGKDVNFFAKVSSRGSNIIKDAHEYKLIINSTLIDSQTTDRFKRTLLKGSVNSSSLINGDNNLNIRYNNINGGTTGICLLDWIEYEFPKKLEIENSLLKFKVRENIERKERVIKIKRNPGSDYIVYKVAPVTKRVEQINYNTEYLFFSDTIGFNDEYFIIDEESVNKPSDVERKTFLNLSKNLPQHDYLAISNNKFGTSVTNYLEFIEDNFNVATSLAYVNDIYDEFGYGYPTAESIKKFIKYKFQNSPDPKPSYLVLIGDANYDYKKIRFIQSGVVGGGNYVPSYGFPNSDNWYAIFDSNGIDLPELYVGRIPINSNEELNFYAGKIENNLNKNNNEWNKTFIFYSSGEGGNQSELDFLRRTHEELINTLILPKPISGNVNHFYKTDNSDFGPISSEYYSNSISKGGIFISYLGHSGTATWDNGISEVSQLKNDVNRNPLITDFGCSTNKFAEPDIVCFGERFLLHPDGQVLGYIGNSALGFTSIAGTAPISFYQSLLEDSSSNLGSSHFNSKLKMYSQLGNTDIFKVYSYTNTLIGDPVINIHLPKKPDFVINNDDVKIINDNVITDKIDSAQVLIVLRNIGLAYDSTYNISISHIYNNNQILEKIINLNSPAFQDSISIFLDIKNKPGYHDLAINVDSDNNFDEINEDNNEFTFSFNVPSQTLRDLTLFIAENPKLDDINILSPSVFNSRELRILLETASSSSFNNSQISLYKADDLVTKIPMNNYSYERVWFRYAVLDDDTLWSTPKSFTNFTGSKYSLLDSTAFVNQKLTNLKVANNQVMISKDTLSISVISAGQFAGGNCVISKNGINLLRNTFFQGMGVAVFDRNTLEVDTSASFRLFNNPTNVSNLANFLNGIEDGKIVALGVAWDAVNNMSLDLRDAIKSLGSQKIDSLEYKGSWAFIGEKGGSASEIIEAVKGANDGAIVIEKRKTILNPEGTLETGLIGLSSKWKGLKLSAMDNSSNNIDLQLFGLNSENILDTLDHFKLLNGAIDLSSLNTNEYKFLKAVVNFKSQDNVSPLLNSFEIDYDAPPELATNYQVTSISQDSVNIGENIELNFDIYNVGESPADSFYVEVDLVNENNTTQTNVFKELVTSIDSLNKKSFNLNYNTVNLSGNYKFNIKIDTEDRILELYKDNNFYSIPFYVKPDTTKPTLNLTFDGKDIFDGEYISPKPNIKVELTDLSLVPVTDTSSVKLFLDDDPVFYANNNSIHYEISNNNPKYTAEFKPELADGDHSVTVFAKDASGNFAEQNGVTKNFVVSNQVKLLDLYNYPNPFSSDTYFTFKLTQVPDQVRIKVYTIAGRLVKEIRKTSAELNYDFNKIYWDGRDEDGDILSNGVYIYRVVIEAGGVSEDITQKLAIVR